MFDLDNTLVELLLMKEQGCREVALAMIDAGLRMSENEAFSRLLQTYFSVGIESDQAFTGFPKQAGQFDDAVLSAGIDAYLKTKKEFLKPYPKVEPVLQKLQSKGITLSIVTDAPKTKARQRLGSMGIESYFRFLIAHEDTDSMKQTGQPLQLAVHLLKKEISDIENSEILRVGDSMVRDIEPAKKMGLRTALSKYGQTMEETGTPDYELTDFKDLLSIV